MHYSPARSPHAFHAIDDSLTMYAPRMSLLYLRGVKNSSIPVQASRNIKAWNCHCNWIGISSIVWSRQIPHLTKASKSSGHVSPCSPISQFDYYLRIGYGTCDTSGHPVGYIMQSQLFSVAPTILALFPLFQAIPKFPVHQRQNLGHTHLKVITGSCHFLSAGRKRWVAAMALKDIDLTWQWK